MGLIYLDTCVVIYLIEQHARWGTLVAKAIESERETRFALSALTKSECLVEPLKRNVAALEQTYRLAFERFTSLDMPEAAFLEAARLRARHSLKTPDALHLACARYHQCIALWTNDERLQKAAGGYARNLLPPDSSA